MKKVKKNQIKILFLNLYLRLIYNIYASKCFYDKGNEVLDPVYIIL